jgi:hypothetical protein
MNLNIELFKKYFLQYHFNYNEDILYVSNIIYNNKPVYHYKFLTYKYNKNTNIWQETTNGNCADYQNSLIPPYNNWFNLTRLLLNKDKKIEIFKAFYIHVMDNIKFYPLYIKNISGIEKKYLFNIILIFKKNEIPKEIIEYIITFFRKIDILKLSN